MSRRTRTILYRLSALLALAGAVVSGALLAVKSQGGSRPRAATHAHTRTTLGGALTFMAPSRDGGPALPVATVVPPDGAAPRRLWPPALINPAALLDVAWRLSLGRPDAREVLFTFDDGPNPGTTDRLLNYLDRAHIHAIFFVCGWRLEGEEPLASRARALLREEIARGHVIGNHTVHHRNMATLTAQQIAYEVDHNADLIEQVTGQRPHLFRPPYGSFSEDVRRHVESRHLELTLWSVDSHDWQMVGDAQGVAMNVIRLLGNMAGGTVLMHDTHPWSVQAAQMVFRWLESENRDRLAHGRTPYRVMEPADYIEGMRARLPMVLAEREERLREQRRTRRGAPDAGPTDDSSAGMENPAMGVSTGDAPPSQNPRSPQAAPALLQPPSAATAAPDAQPAPSGP